MAGFGDVLARLATKTADSVWTKANAGKGNAKTLREAIQEKQQEKQQQQPEQQVQQPVQQANKIELKPQGNDSKKDAKKAEEKKQKRTQGEKAFGNFMQAFRNNAQRGINDISNGNMFDAQAQAEEVAKSDDQLAPIVETAGSNNAKSIDAQVDDEMKNYLFDPNSNKYSINGQWVSPDIAKKYAADTIDSKDVKDTRNYIESGEKKLADEKEAKQRAPQTREEIADAMKNHPTLSGLPYTSLSDSDSARISEILKNVPSDSDYTTATPQQLNMLAPKGNAEETKETQQAIRDYVDEYYLSFANPDLYNYQDYGYSRPGEDLGFNVGKYNDVAAVQGNASDVAKALANETQEKEETKGTEDIKASDELTYGFTQDQLNDMSDMALINLELQNNKALADYVKDNYGYDVGNKDAFGDFLYIEDPYDTSSKTDLARALFGLDENVAYNADDGIQDRLMNMLYSSGMERGLEGDDLVNAIVDTYFDPEDIVYLDKWTGLGEDAADYQAQNVLTYDDVAALVGRMADNEKYGGSGTMDEFLNQAGLDINDVGAWAMVGNMLNRDPSALRDLSDNDLALISSIFGDAGDMANFAFADSDRGKDYKEHEWKPSERTSYSMNDFMNALGQGAFDRMYNGEGVSSTLADWDQADTLMKAIEDASGRKVVRDR